MDDHNNYQRVGASSNAEVGRIFELLAKAYFENECKINLDRPFPFNLGIGNKSKQHCFDLGSHDPKIIVECKNHKWTGGDKVPSAKMTTWNLEMYYFYLAPRDYKKIFFCLKDYSEKRQKTLAEYYIETYTHLIPPNVEIWEYCEKMKCVNIYNQF